MKDVLNFILSLFALVYVAALVLGFTGIINLQALLGDLYFETIIYLPAFLLGALALVSFASKSFKLIFFVLTAIAVLALILFLIDPTFFGLIAWREYF